MAPSSGQRSRATLSDKLSECVAIKFEIPFTKDTLLFSLNPAICEISEALMFRAHRNCSVLKTDAVANNASCADTELRHILEAIVNKTEIVDDQHYWRHIDHETPAMLTAYIQGFS